MPFLYTLSPLPHINPHHLILTALLLHLPPSAATAPCPRPHPLPPGFHALHIHHRAIFPPWPPNTSTVQHLNTSAAFPPWPPNTSPAEPSLLYILATLRKPNGELRPIAIGDILTTLPIPYLPYTRPISLADPLHQAISSSMPRHQGDPLTPLYG